MGWGVRGSDVCRCPLFFQPFRSGLGSYLKKFAYKNASTGEFTVPPPPLAWGVHYIELHLCRGPLGCSGEGQQQTRCQGDVHMDQTDGLSSVVGGGKTGECS